MRWRERRAAEQTRTIYQRHRHPAQIRVVDEGRVVYRNGRRARLRRQGVQAEELLLGVAAFEVHLKVVCQRVVAGHVDLLQHFAFLNGEEIAVVDRAAGVRPVAAGEEAERAAVAVPSGHILAVEVRKAPVLLPAARARQARIRRAGRSAFDFGRKGRAVGEEEFGTGHRWIPAGLSGRNSRSRLEFRRWPDPASGSRCGASSPPRPRELYDDFWRHRHRPPPSAASPLAH